MPCRHWTLFKSWEALDLGSVLCQEDGRVLGAVVDVFGQISQPHYLVLPSESCKKDWARLRAELEYVGMVRNDLESGLLLWQDLPPVGAAVLAATGMQEPRVTCDKLR